MSSCKKIVTSGDNSYTVVTDFASLPDAALHPQDIYFVVNSTGIWPFTHKPTGLYYSNGSCSIELC